MPKCSRTGTYDLMGAIAGKMLPLGNMRSVNREITLHHSGARVGLFEARATGSSVTG